MVDLYDSNCFLEIMVKNGYEDSWKEIENNGDLLSLIQGNKENFKIIYDDYQDLLMNIGDFLNRVY